MSLISLNNLTLAYGDNVVIRDLSLSLEKGDFLCVVGPNGAGKTTLIKGILGLLKPLKGEVILDGLEKNHVGYIPQETTVDNNFPASVYEIVLSGTLNRLGLKSFYRKSEKGIALKNLKLLGITQLKDKSFSDLSGGQRQKVLLARSLSATTKLLILDEPSNNLDSKSKKDFYDLIKKLNQKHGITIIMITHDLDHDNLLGNKILSLREGDIFFGTTSEFIKKVHHE